MPLPVQPLQGGRAEGPALVVAGIPAELGTSFEGAIVILPATAWPRRGYRGPTPRAMILDGDRAPPGPWPSCPVVLGSVGSLFRDGERLEVDADAATVRIPGVREVDVVTAFLQRSDGKLLLLRRSDRVGSFQGRWAAVSGFLEAVPPLEQAHREVEEETGIGRAEIASFVAGPIVGARAGDVLYLVHPFRFAVLRPTVRRDWEHTAEEWVEPEELLRRPTVPRLWEAWRAVAEDGPPKS